MRGLRGRQGPDRVGGAGYCQEGGGESLKRDAERHMAQCKVLLLSTGRLGEAGRLVGQVLANFSREGPDNKCCRHCAPRGEIMAFM